MTLVTAEAWRQTTSKVTRSPFQHEGVSPNASMRLHATVDLNARGYLLLQLVSDSLT